jgi:ABC-type antimicrobial peptide transport system permease subunit
MAIRVALGATTADVMRLVFGSSLRPFAAGIVVGVSGGLVFARLLANALIGVSPFDVAAFVAPTALMALVAALATAVPARRASVVDPMVTFRS